MKNNKITLRATALCLALCLAVVCLCDLVLPGGEVKVYENLIRLHILAASDSDYDQALKLKVRDAILAAGVFEAAEDADGAEAMTAEAEQAALDIANRVLYEEGAPYGARIEYGLEVYPTREYEGIRLPAGEYRSLRIVLGEGEGQNWWCVLFPPLCLGAAGDSLTAAGLTEGQTRVFKTGKTRYRLRFKLLELFSFK